MYFMASKRNEETIQVTHINIRLSISILLLKLILLEIIAAVLIIIFHASLYEFDGERLAEMGIKIFNIPFFLVLVLLKILLTVIVILQWLNEYYEITKTIIYHRKGLIFKTEEKYFLEKIALVEVKQSLLGKILNFGTISLYDEKGNKYEELYLIHNPLRYAKVIEDLLPKAEIRKQIVREHLIEKNIFDTE